MNETTNKIPRGRRTPRCPRNGCHCDRVCGVAVHEGWVAGVPLQEFERLEEALQAIADAAELAPMEDVLGAGEIARKALNGEWLA
jgi:hypothetical protein